MISLGGNVWICWVRLKLNTKITLGYPLPTTKTNFSMSSWSLRFDMQASLRLKHCPPPSIPTITFNTIPYGGRTWKLNLKCNILPSLRFSISILFELGFDLTFDMTLTWLLTWYHVSYEAERHSPAPPAFFDQKLN